VILALVLTGCTVGPNYRPPEPKAPDAWAETADDIAAGEATVVSWWTLFEDPQLTDLVGRAVRSNQNLKLAQARIRQAQAQRMVAAAAGLPSLDASGSYTRYSRSGSAFGSTTGGAAGGLSPTAFGSGGDLYQAGVDGNWNLDVFGGVRRSVEAANANIGAAQEDLRDTLVTLLGQVATNYFTIRGNQRRIAVALDNLRTQEDTVRVAQGRLEAGLGSRLEVAQAETLLATTESQLPALEISVRQAIHQLGVLIGSEPESLLPELLEPRLLVRPPVEVPVGLPADLLRRRPDIRRAERQLAAATAQVGVAVADLFPKLSLTGGYGYQSTNASSLVTPGSEYWNWGPGLTLPLFSGGQIRGNIQVQTAIQEQALATYENTVLTALQSVEDAITAYTQTEAARASLTRAVDASREATQISQDLYQKGLVDFLNVLQSETSLYQAQDRLMQNEQQTLTSLVALFQALGGGWEVLAAEPQTTEKKG
jgi:NodT family efflux transporter outer membrane factor (OMF) lipoprotein